MRHTTSLFWTCHCQSSLFHRPHEERCPHCGDSREMHSADDANIAELLLYHSEYLTPDEITALERVGKPVLNEVWLLIQASGGIEIVKVSPSMLEVMEEYTRIAIEAGLPWDERALDYDWSYDDNTYAVYGINTTTCEVVGYE